MLYLSLGVLHDYKTTSEINDFHRSIILFEIPTRQPTCVHFRLTLWCAVFTLQCVISAALLSGLRSYFLCESFSLHSSGLRLASLSHSLLAPNLSDCLPACVRASCHCTPPACFGLCSQERSAVTQAAHTPLCVCESLQAFCLRVRGVQNKRVRAPFSRLAA